MLDINEFRKESILIIGAGLVGYERITRSPSTYSPPTKEEIIEAYQNVPLFNRTLETVVAHLIYTIERLSNASTKS